MVSWKVSKRAFSWFKLMNEEEECRGMKKRGGDGGIRGNGRMEWNLGSLLLC